MHWRDPVTSFEFAFLADIQLGCYATFSGLDDHQIAEARAQGIEVPQVPKVEGFEWDSRRYQAAIRVVNQLSPAFVVIGGDLVNDLTDTDQVDEFFRLTAGIDDEIPVRWIPGNHDIAYDFAAPTAESVAAYRSIFGPDHYSFRHGGALFIGLNTSVIDHPENVPELHEAQLSFLREELAGATRSDVGAIVLLGHHPLFVESADEDDSYWNLPSERRRTILDLVHRYGVAVGFAGHLHRNATAREGDFVQVISGPVGLPLGPDPSGLTRVQVNDQGVSHRYQPVD